jgi:hypothetical protein
VLFDYSFSFLFLLDDCLFLDLSFFFTSTFCVSSIAILPGVLSTFYYFLSSYFADTLLFNTDKDGLVVSTCYSTFPFSAYFGSTLAFSSFFGSTFDFSAFLGGGVSFG